MERSQTVSAFCLRMTKVSGDRIQLPNSLLSLLLPLSRRFCKHDTIRRRILNCFFATSVRERSKIPLFTSIHLPGASHRRGRVVITISSAIGLSGPHLPLSPRTPILLVLLYSDLVSFLDKELSYFGSMNCIVFVMPCCPAGLRLGTVWAAHRFHFPHRIASATHVARDTDRTFSSDFEFR